MTDQTSTLTPPALRTPRQTVLINGTQVQAEDWSVTNNSYYQADHFEVTLPVAALPLGLQRVDLAEAADLEVEIRGSLDGQSWTSFIIGRTDEIEDNYVTGLIRISGRDHTADFIETKTTEKFTNQTASQIVSTLAGRHSLSADVTATTTKVGHYYEIDHDRITDNSTEWDLLTYLAQKEGYDVWVTGKTVHFHPADQTYGNPIPVTYVPATPTSIASGNFTELGTRRSLTLASDVTVNVYSWNAKQKQAFKVTAKATKTRGRQPKGTPQVYSFRVPGLTRDQAQQLAQNKAEEITRHERLVDIGLPGDLVTTARSQVKLTGTGTSFDQLYWVDEVERRMSFSEGFRMSIKAKNHSPQSVTSI